MALKVKVDGDGSGFQATLDKLSEQAAGFGKGLNAKMTGNFSEAIMGIVPGLTGALAGIFAVDSMKEFFANFAEESHKISEGAIRLNIDTTKYQQLNNLLKEQGMTAEDAGSSMDHVAQSLMKIKQEPGTQEARLLTQEFIALGVSLDDIKTGNYQDVFFKIFQGMQGISPTTEQINALKETMGRSGTAMLPAMQEGLSSGLANSNIIDPKHLAEMEEEKKQRAEASGAWSAMWNGIGKIGVDAWTGAVRLTSPGQWIEWTKSGTEIYRERMAKEGFATSHSHVLALQRAQEMIKEQQDADAAATAKAAKHAAEKVAAIDKETEAIKKRNEEAAMTPEEHKKYLQTQVSNIQMELDQGGNDIVRQAQLRKQMAEDQGELGRLDRAKTKPEHHHMSLERLGNAAIGGIMLSHGGDQWKKHIEEGTKHLANIDKKTQSARTPGANRDYH